MVSKRNSTHNQKAKLAADYNDLLKELSSPKMSVVGCYEIGETIAEGAYGKVKLGYHQLTGQRVAIKKISKKHAPLMAREIHHQRQLRHPNIVMLYEILTTENAIFIVCEHCPNGELFDLLTQSGRFSEQQAKIYFGQLIDAVKHCHERGIIHRDLKLENILLDADYRVKIGDFGFARQADDKQLLETFCGSLAYSAPEIIRRQKYTGPETDIWSLGVILYTLLAGELPFDDDNEIVVERKIVNLDYHIPDYFSPDAKDLVRRILQLDPTQRLTLDEILRHRWLASTPTNDNDNDPIDNDADCESVPSTRCSAYSDVDSIFSTPKYQDDCDSYSDVSSPRNSFIKSPLSPQWSSFSHSKRNAVIPPPRQQPLPSFEPVNTRFQARPSRFSAPTTSHRPYTSPYTSAASCRQSMPTALPSCRQRNSTYSNFASMEPMEQRLFTALMAAGFDENTVMDMRSDGGNVLGTLWHMLMENLCKHQEGTLCESKVQAQQKPWNTSCVGIDKATQTDEDRMLHVQDKQRPPCEENTTALPVAVPVPVPVAVSKTSSMSSSSASLPTRHTTGATSTNDKTGWLTSVKSWFGPGKQDTARSHGAQNAPLSLPGHPASGYHAAFSKSPQVPNAWSAIPSAGAPCPDDHTKTTTTTLSTSIHSMITPPPAAHNKPSLDSYYKASNAFGPAKPPKVLSGPWPPTNVRPVPDTPKPSTSGAPAVSSKQVESVAPVTKSVHPPTEPCSASEDTPDKWASAQKTLSSQCPQQANAKNEASPPSPIDSSPSACTPIITRSTPMSGTTATSTVPDVRVPPAMDDDSDDDSTLSSSPATSVSSDEDAHPTLEVPPTPTPTRSWPLVMREAPMKRFEFAPPRSRLSNYGVFDGGRGKPLGAKVIIEEEEEEE